ncbi:uncharacterized protein LOC120196590 [Hibiscus syriacus]|uniref:uncharacterized protein LOC120196590 n=1 Tax=Hibiscus syriacus TaxID=106335 RepID=UPI0019213538|nr:uncharacterized protein LOC120196590 [Hibiscus syriacus]
MEGKRRSVINELTRGQELARQLQAHLNAPSSSADELQCSVTAAGTMRMADSSTSKKRKSSQPAWDGTPHDALSSKYPRNNHHRVFLFAYQNGLKVKTQDLDNIHYCRHQTYTSFPCTSTTPNVVFSSSPSVVNNDGVGNLSPSNFVSPAKSRTNLSFQTRYDQTQNIHDYEVIEGATATSATSSPAAGLDMPFVNSQFDQSFTFDNDGYFP